MINRKETDCLYLYSRTADAAVVVVVAVQGCCSAIDACRRRLARSGCCHCPSGHRAVVWSRRLPCLVRSGCPWSKLMCGQIWSRKENFGFKITNKHGYWCQDPKMCFKFQFDHSAWDCAGLSTDWALPALGIFHWLVRLIVKCDQIWLRLP